MNKPQNVSNNNDFNINILNNNLKQLWNIVNNLNSSIAKNNSSIGRIENRVGYLTNNFNILPIYSDHISAPNPNIGYVTTYFLEGDYNFIYFKWPDGSRHNRRLPLSMEDIE